MCEIYAGQDPARYRLTARSLRIDGHSTSIRLENAFWEVLERMATSEGRTLNDLIAKLYGEVVARQEQPANFTSILRSSCLIYLDTAGQDRAPSAAA